jgi:hypothetical protein
MRDVVSKPALLALLLGFLFCGTSIAMLTAGGGIPAVFDGNETFSSILHARNLQAFGLQKSAGLADESTSAASLAHPVVHTHQGNVPRLYAAFLYAIGLTSPTSQVLATVLPVGFASVLLLFAALERFGGSGFAATSSFILLTDYILFVQWQVVTYRLWHFAFIAALLAITIAYRSSRRPSLLLALFLTSLFLFYFELVFAAFLSTAIAVLALILWRNQIKKGVLFVGIQLAGAAVSALILTAQLAAYLGWNGFLMDLKLTYVSRNLGIETLPALADLRSFVEQYNIAFLYNFMDPAARRPGALFLDSIFRWGLQAYTPPFAYSVLIVICGVLVALLAPSGRVRAPGWTIGALAAMTGLAWLFGSWSFVFIIIFVGAGVLVFVAPDPLRPSQKIEFVDAGIVVGVPGLLFLLMAVSFVRFLGFDSSSEPFFGYSATLFVAFAAGLAFLIFLLFPKGRAAVPLDAVVRAAALLCVAIGFARFHGNLYDRFSALWDSAVPGPLMPPYAQSAGMVLATVCAASLAALGPSLSDPVKLQLRERAGQVFILIGSFLGGLLVVVVLSPGYVFSGYMARYLNPLVLPFALLIGFSIYAAAVLGKKVYAAYGPRAMLFARAVHLVLPAVLVGWWLCIQVADARIFPPTSFTVLKALERVAPSKPKIVANSYPAAFSVVTGQWAYLDETFSAGRIGFSPSSGYQYLFDKKYLWFADRASNREYEKPDLFICFLPPSYRSAASRLEDSPGLTGCSMNRVVQLAQQRPGRTWPRHTILDHDASGRDAWAIVKLDWDYPPYLNARPNVAIGSEGGAQSLIVTYGFRQQDGAPEMQTDVQLWPIQREGTTCWFAGKSVLATTRTSSGKAVLSLDTLDVAVEFVVVAYPQTRTKVGSPFFSLPFRVKNGAGVVLSPACDSIRDDNEHIWPQAEGS